MSKLFLCLLLAGVCCPPAGAVQFTCREADAALGIDGNLGDAAWAKSDTGTDFMVFAGGVDVPVRALKQTEWRMLHDAGHLYIGIRAQEPAMQRIKAVKGNVFAGDCIEVFIRLRPNPAEYYHFAVNPDGDAYLGLKRDDKYQAASTAGMKVGAKKGPDFWSAEIAVPLSLLQTDKRTLISGESQVNICRNDAVSGILSTWSFEPVGASGFHNPEMLSALSFAGRGAPPSVRSNFAALNRDGVLSNPSLLPSPGSPGEIRRWQLGESAGWSGGAVTSSSGGRVAWQRTTIMNVAGSRYTAVLYIKNTSVATLFAAYKDAANTEKRASVELPQTGGDFAVKTVEFSMPADVKQVTEVGIENKGQGALGLAYLQLTSPGYLSFNCKPRERFDLGPNQAVYYPLFAEVGVSPDMPLPVPWFNHQTFGDKSTGSLRLEVPGRGYRLTLDLPEGIALKSYTDMGKRYSGITLTGRAPVVRPEGRYSRYEFTIDYLLSMTPESMTLSTTLPYGAERTGFYSFKWDGGSVSDQKIGFKVIRMPEVRAPRRFIAEIVVGHTPNPPGGPTMTQADYAEYARGFKRLGINSVCLGVPWEYGDSSCSAGRELNTALQSEGIYASAILNPFWEGWPERLTDFPDAQAVDIRGNVSKTTICPSYRGRFYRNWFDIIRMYAEKGGVSWLEIDWEVYILREREYCFCRRCKDAFKEFIAKNYPGLPYRDPAEIETKRDDKALYAAWLDFRNSLIEDWLGETRREMTKYVKDAGTKSSPAAWITFVPSIYDGYDHRRLLKQVDFMGPMIYAYSFPEPSVRAVGDTLYNYWKSLGRPKGKFVPYLSPGDVGPNHAMLSPAVGNKYQILEAVAAGAGGFTMYYWGVMDGQGLKAVAEAISQIAPVEDIILDGTLEEVPSPSSSIKIRRLVHPKKGRVIFVSEYSRQEMAIPITESVDAPCELIDLSTKETVAKLHKGENRLTIDLKEDRAKLFFMGNRKDLRQ